ncbi:MAG TPA: HAD family phosphatase [Aeromicrobium sp.]|nr:HAD family phosphatase [Aeromicrobium sp.]
MWAAVLWDLDGTLVDTEPVWMAAELELAAEHGVEWTHDDGLALVGLALPDSGAYIQRRLESELTPAAIVDYLVKRVAASLEQFVPWRPGALDLVAAFADAGVPQALVTMSYAPIATAVAHHVPFAAVVTGDAVVMGKPDPEAYLTAASLLGCEPADCLAIEDSPTGAASASAAGCEVLVIPHLVDVPMAPRRFTHETLTGLSPSMLWAGRLS